MQHNVDGSADSPFNIVTLSLPQRRASTLKREVIQRQGLDIYCLFYYQMHTHTHTHTQTY